MAKVEKKNVTIIDKENISISATYSIEAHDAHIEECHGPKLINPKMYLVTLHEVTLGIGAQELDLLPLLDEDSRKVIVEVTNKIHFA